MDRLFAVLCCVHLGCGGVAETSTTGGGSGGTTQTSTCEGGCDAGSGGATGSTTTTTATEESCQSDPVGCEPPDPMLAFDPMLNGVSGFIGPISPWEDAGGSISCLGPFSAGEVFTRVVVGLSVEPLPGETMLLDAWVQDDDDATGHVFDWQPLVYDSSVPGPGGMFLAGFSAGPLEGADGHYVCVSAPLSDYWPPALDVADCEVPGRAQWLGLPWYDDDGDGVATTNELTVAPLACPKDTTTADGTPAVGTYHAALPYGVWP